MKTFIKRIIPLKIKLSLVHLLNYTKLIRLYIFDLRRFAKYSFLFSSNKTQNNLRSKITFHYHSIEKGLSNANFRYGFGKNAFTQLFTELDKYIELNYDKNDHRFQQAISVIKKYIDFHDNSDVNIDWIKNKFEEYSNYLLTSYYNDGGFERATESSLPEFSDLNFKELSENRHSIRDFGEENVNKSDIIEAVNMATKTPSVCNRQAYKVYHIHDRDLLKQVLEIQNGLTGNGENLKDILLVTSSREYMIGPSERNQTYIDGGMFLMSLIYSLTFKNLATCALNANFTLKKEKLIREILNIGYSEDIIAFIAVGTYANEFKYAKSPRDPGKDILISL